MLSTTVKDVVGKRGNHPMLFGSGNEKHMFRLLVAEEIETPHSQP